MPSADVIVNPPPQTAFDRCVCTDHPQNVAAGVASNTDRPDTMEGQSPLRPSVEPNLNYTARGQVTSSVRRQRDSKQSGSSTIH